MQLSSLQVRAPGFKWAIIDELHDYLYGATFVVKTNIFWMYHLTSEYAAFVHCFHMRFYLIPYAFIY